MSKSILIPFLSILILISCSGKKKKITKGKSESFQSPSQTNFESNQNKIVFRSKRDGNYEIYIMNSDGSNQTRLTNHIKGDFPHGFSSDGSKIIFNSARDGNDEIYVMDIDGRNQTRLTNNSVSDFNPQFSPSNSNILYTAHKNGRNNIFIMNSDGSNQRN